MGLAGFYALLLSLAAASFAVFARFRSLRPAAFQVLAVSVLILALETAGQLWAFLHPAYEVLYLEPERSMGWRQEPGLDYIWTGHHWYARDFANPVKANSLGFHDREHAAAKSGPRVALLGDSMVEALQVPLEKTAASLLEKASGREVLNFGVSAFGVGQQLLAYETHASRFKPDHVFAFVAGYHMTRTATRLESGTISKTEPLWIRPTFRLDGKRLVREPAADYEKFVDTRRRLLAERGHSWRKKPRVFLRDWITAREVYSSLYFSRWGRPVARLKEALLGKTPRGDDLALEIPEDVLAVNLAVLAELGRRVRRDGGKLIIVDVSHYFQPRSKVLAERLRAFSAKEGIGYLPFYERLLAANDAGRPVRWRHDGHLNELGNELFAQAMHEALR